MITASPTSRLSSPSPGWRELWRDAITDAGELLRAVGLGGRTDLLPPDDAGFPLRVPRGFAARMRQGDASDPLLLQVLPRRKPPLEFRVLPMRLALGERPHLS